MARVFYSCGKLRFIPEKLLEKMARKIIDDRSALEMDGCDIQITVYAIAILSRFQLICFSAAKG